jgi:hypothetical protein
MSHYKMVSNALRTPDGTVIESTHRHDYVTYRDQNGNNYMIDGGLDYVRSSANGDEEHLAVYLEDGHEKVRNALTWGTYGINGDQPLKRVKLSDMNSDHIRAVLKDNEKRPTVYPSVVTAMQDELQFRNYGLPFYKDI